MSPQSSPVPLTGEALYRDAIKTQIVGPLGLPDNAVDALYAQAMLETGKFTAWYFPSTNSLFNRHIGSGRGYWIGSGKSKDMLVSGVDYIFVSNGDPDLRCYTDVYQCCQDMAQLLQDPLYAQALAGLQRGSSPDYFNGLQAAGYSATPGYATSLQHTLESFT